MIILFCLRPSSWTWNNVTRPSGRCISSSAHFALPSHNPWEHRATEPEALEQELLGRMLYGSPRVCWGLPGTSQKPRTEIHATCIYIYIDDYKIMQNDRGSLISPTPFPRQTWPLLNAFHIQGVYSIMHVCYIYTCYLIELAGAG